ncbi:MAG: hypothetical protein J5554_13855 [Paludibacteraceae bacterium]|nr:hypothetical protein [Paludibacteraceae bacterium]
MKKGKFMLAALLGLYASTSFTMAAVTPKEPAKNADGYYQISEYAELVWFKNYVNSSVSSSSAENKAKAELTADITAPTDEPWNESIGKTPSKGGFAGVFNGNGHAIKDLNIEPMGNNQMGLFGTLKGNGQILNLNLSNATCGVSNSKASVAGGIAASIESGEIVSCSFSGKITATNEAAVGGICGYFEKGTIRNCFAAGSFQGSVTCSGIAGEILGGTVVLSYANATLSGKNTYAIGYEHGDDATIKNCYYTTKTKNDGGATSDEDFASGKITYLLNNGEETPFKQTIGTEEFPSFAGEAVYEYTFCNGSLKYTNDKSLANVHIDHIFGPKNEANAPTCTTKGNNVYWLCEHEPGVYYKNPNVGHYETYANESEVFIPALGHHMVEHKAEAAKCEETGNKLYYTCVNEPGVIYANAEATKKTTLEEVTIPAIGHQLEEHTLEGTTTCTDGDDPNYIYYTCKNDPTEFFAKDKVTRINNPQQAIDDVTGHIWGEWAYKNTEGDVDTYVRTCQRNAAHTEKATVPHAWGEAELLSSEPAKDTYTHTCSSKYGEHSEIYSVEFPTVEATYYSQITGERDTTFRENTEFKPVDTENDLLFVGKESTISGNNVVKGEECENLVIVDKVNFRTPNDFTAKELVYDRKNSLAYQTFILPYDVPTSEFNGGVYEFRRYDSNARTIWFYSVEGIAEAGTPYILYRKTVAEETNLHANLKNIKLEASEWDNITSIANNKCFFRGTYEYIQRTVDSQYESVYIFSQNKFCLAKGVAEVYGFRAYVELEKPTASPSLGIMFDDQLTGVATIDADGNLSVGNVDVYDMNGRLVRKNVESATCLQGLKPGVYVVNGEKFVKTDKE